jgi:hypothetical protein
MRDAGKFFKTLFFAVVAVASLMFTLAREARAADKLVVIHAEGDGSDAIANEIRNQLPKGLSTSTGDLKKFDAALAKAGHKGAMGKALDSTKQRDKLLEKVRKAATNAKVDVVVILRVKKNKKDRTVTILVVDPTSAALAREDEVTLSGTKKSDADSKPVVASVTPALEKFAPPPEPPPPPKKEEKIAAKGEEGEEEKKEGEEGEEEKKEEPGAERKTGDVASALFIVGAGVDLGNRSFEYHQPITNNLRAYRVSFAPMLNLNAELYPLAGSSGPLKGLGLAGHYAQALALQSAPQGGDKFQTTWNRWFIGLRYRILLGDKGMFVSPVIGYGGENFTFSGLEEPLKSQAPAAKYTFVKLGVDGRFPVGPVAIMAGVGYLFTSSPSGDNTELVSGRFPHMNVDGVDANIGVGVGIIKGLEARIAFRYTRFFYAFNPEPGERYVAGGALEQLSSLHLGAAYVF